MLHLHRYSTHDASFVIDTLHAGLREYLCSLDAMGDAMAEGKSQVVDDIIQKDGQKSLPCSYVKAGQKRTLNSTKEE